MHAARDLCAPGFWDKPLGTLFSRYEGRRHLLYSRRSSDRTASYRSCDWAADNLGTPQWAGGFVHTELHPFDWQHIALLAELPPNGVNTEIVSVAAPLHERQFLGNWTGNIVTGVAQHVWISDDGTDYHNMLSATAHIKAPTLPAPWTSHSSLIGYTEEFLQYDPAYNPTQLRVDLWPLSFRNRQRDQRLSAGRQHPRAL